MFSASVALRGASGGGGGCEANDPSGSPIPVSGADGGTTYGNAAPELEGNGVPVFIVVP